MGNSEQEGSLSNPPQAIPHPKGKGGITLTPQPQTAQSLFGHGMYLLSPLLCRLTCPPPHLIDTPPLYCTLGHALWLFGPASPTHFLDCESPCIHEAHPRKAALWRAPSQSWSWSQGGEDLFWPSRHPWDTPSSHPGPASPSKSGTSPQSLLVLSLSVNWP